MNRTSLRSGTFSRMVSSHLKELRQIGGGLHFWSRLLELFLRGVDLPEFLRSPYLRGTGRMKSYSKEWEISWSRELRTKNFTEKSFSPVLLPEFCRALGMCFLVRLTYFWNAWSFQISVWMIGSLFLWDAPGLFFSGLWFLRFEAC